MLEKIRTVVQECIEKQLFDSAAFWADKALSLSDGHPNDLAVYTKVLYSRGQYQRAAHLLESRPALLQWCPALRYLAARCYAASKQWDEVLLLLEPVDDHGSATAQGREGDASSSGPTVIVLPSMSDVEGASLLLRGLAHEGLGNIPEAVNCFKASLAADVFCEEALEKLRYLRALSAEDERNLMASLSFRKQCTVEEQSVVQYLYRTRLIHAGQPAPSAPSAFSVVPPPIDVAASLAENADIVVAQAERLFDRFDTTACAEVVTGLVSRDPHNVDALLLHAACSVETGRRADELFSIGHRLVDQFPTSPLAWYVVACYYLVTCKHQLVLKYLTKAVSLDPNFVLAHMAFGLAFAAEGEHDQAIAAYSNAARLMRGSHWPLLYLGKEYFMTGATSISNRFMRSAQELAPTDPVVLQEIAVVLYHAKDYAKAEQYLVKAAEVLVALDPHVTIPAWEPLYNNMAHVCRKQRKYELALRYHFHALQLKPNEPSTLTAIAFVHLLAGDYDSVVTYCNQSLYHRREDQFTIAILQEAVDRAAEDPAPLYQGSSLDALSPAPGYLESPLLENDVRLSGQETAMVIE